MSKWIIAALLCSLAPSALGQTVAEPQPTAAPIEEIRVSTSRIALPDTLRNIWPDEFEEIKGDYRLSNGKWMRLSMWGNRMYARIDDMPRTQLVALSPHEFVALDETMKVTIDTWHPPMNSAVILLSNRRVAGAPVIDITRLTASR